MRFRFKEPREGKILSLGSLLSSIVGEFQLDESFIFENIRSNWSLIVGDIISTHSAPVRIVRETLIIAADHSVFAGELHMLRESLLNKIKDRLGADIIRNIRVEIKKLR
ncbi:MAG: DUF721 domain-containing protein [Spirochaetes bacterium]|nr:MAG: DUF721 domain-containing protein [Spirochaetota bacterium]